MEIKVMYHSMTGNTKKVAETIASVAGVSAEAIGGPETFSKPVDLLFIGDGIYAGGMSRKTKAFIAGLDSAMVKHAAVFGTYGGEEKVITAMKTLLKEKGIMVLEESFACKGKAWFIANQNHPNQEDIKNASAFGSRSIESVKNG